MRVLRLNAVLEKTGLGKTKLYEKIGKKEFPQSLPLGERAVGWLESEVDEWILGCLAKREPAKSNISQSK